MNIQAINAKLKFLYDTILFGSSSYDSSSH